LEEAEDLKMVLKEISTYLTENEKGKLPWNYQEMVEA